MLKNVKAADKDFFNFKNYKNSHAKYQIKYKI